MERIKKILEQLEQNSQQTIQHIEAISKLQYDWEIGNMVRLTKRQQKDQDRIEAWYQGQEFKEYSKSTPRVPELELEEVIEQYVPKEISSKAAFYTPLKMAAAFWGNLLEYVPIDLRQGPISVMDLGAGIGNLLYPVYNGLYQMTAIEADQRAYDVGKRLYGNQINWICGSVYEFTSVQKYDLVISNPPFNIKWCKYGIDNEDQKSEHLFLDAALRLCKPGGFISFLAPYNFWDKMTKKGRKFIGDRTELLYDFGEMEGEFRFTGMRVHQFVFQNDGVYEEGRQVDIKLGKTVVNDLYAVTLSEEVYREFCVFVGELPDGVRRAITEFKKQHLKVAAKWIKDNPKEYGFAFYYGFREIA